MCSNLVSIIVPVYNVEKYIVKCIESIINQSYHNLEIIFINDGSTDNCYKILENYKKIDTRITIIHTSNQGVGMARNVGLDIAKGSYIYFLDSDDWIPLQAIETMVNIALNENADLVFADRLMVKENQSLDITINNCDFYQVLNQNDAVLKLARKNWAPWNKLYKREIFNGIRFPNLKIYEDEAIMFDILKKCNKVILTSKILYYYRKRKDSATSLKWSIKKYDGIIAWKKNYEIVKNEFQFVLGVVESKLIDLCIYNFDNMVDVEEYYNYALNIKDILKKNKIHILLNSKIKLSKKIRIVLILSSWTLYKKIYINNEEI